jgi:hypothetical protein
LKFKFYKDEWDLFFENCDFTDEETKIIALIRKEWALIDIAEELLMSISTLVRKKKKIENKIIHYISKGSR